MARQFHPGWGLDKMMHPEAPALTAVPHPNRNKDLVLVDWIHIFILPAITITTTATSVITTNSSNNTNNH